jgi:hypothetical protein
LWCEHSRAQISFPDLTLQIHFPYEAGKTYCAPDGMLTSQLRTSVHGSRAIAQAVSRRLPTVAARIRAQVRSRGICGGQSGTGAGFLRVLRFPLPILIPPTAPQSPSSIIWGCTIGQLVADVRSGLSFTPPQETKKSLSR